ncbi:MAG: hypothetical protein QNJ41_28465 [Xenococcaceae cyanobacterium MO_188.B32]|nr:hypothetical protein [Xenococcaceae cyanobacterium MO_188.B32]
MDATEILNAYRENGFVLSPQCCTEIKNEQKRDGIYRLIPNNPRDEFHELLVQLFEEEIEFRNGLWRREREDDNDLFENIYQCAFLLHQLGRVEDVLLMWRAKNLNMDVGSRLDAQYLVGAGVLETIKFLESSTDPLASDALRYVNAWRVSADLDDLPKWREHQMTYFNRHT